MTQVYLGAYGNWSMSANTNFVPLSSNWQSTGSSDSGLAQQQLQLVSANGSISISTTQLYSIAGTFSATEFGYTGGGIFGIFYYPTVGNGFTLASAQLNGGETSYSTALTLSAGSKLVPFLLLSKVYTVVFAKPCILTTLRITPMTQTTPLFYQSSANSVINFMSNYKRLLLTGVLTSGYQIMFPLTIDGTSTGTPLFTNIYGVVALAQPSTPTNSVTAVPTCSLDSVSLQSVTVNIIMPTSITSLQINTVKAAAAGTVVFLEVTGL